MAQQNQTTGVRPNYRPTPKTIKLKQGLVAYV